MERAHRLLRSRPHTRPPRPRLLVWCLVVAFLFLCGLPLARSQDQGRGPSRRPPGTPLRHVAFEAVLNKKLNRLLTQVETGDVVLVKPGGKKEARGSWVAVVRFETRASRESATGFATIIRNDGSNFRGLVLGPNTVFLTKNGKVTPYLAEDASAKLRGPERKALYRLDEESSR